VVYVEIICFYNYIAKIEEKLLQASFLEEYPNYKKKTGKWVQTQNIWK